MSIKHFFLCPECGRVPCSPPPFVTVACPQCGCRRSDDGFPPPVGAPERLYPSGTSRSLARMEISGTVENFIGETLGLVTPQPSGTTSAMTVESQRADIVSTELRDFPRLYSTPAESVRVFVGGVELPPGGDGGEGGRAKKVAEKRKPPAPWCAGERWLDLP